jgi:sulfane dehydrogenase subunit SoxC
VLSKSLVRFRSPWRWSGGPSVLMSRATDESGAVQPTRAALMAARGANYRYHYNAIQSWKVGEAGEIGNAYV